MGDLSGKFGKISTDPFVAEYSDSFASTTPGIGAYFGNRSFVIHFPNKTRITCANFKVIAGMANLGPTATITGSGSGGGSGSGSSDGGFGGVPNDNSSATPIGGPGVGSTLSPTASPVTVSGASAVRSTAVWATGAAWLFTAILFML